MSWEAGPLLGPPVTPMSPPIDADREHRNDEMATTSAAPPIHHPMGDFFFWISW